jgi:predicted RNA-binding Zn ribbon-like protein
MESYPSARPQRQPFQLNGGHAALDFVNTLDDRFKDGGPVELLTDYANLLRFAQQSGLLEPARARALAKSVSTAAAERALAAARELREALAAVVYGQLAQRTPSAAELRRLEHHFHEAARHRQLHAGRSGAADPALEWQWGRYAREAQLPVWMLAQAAQELLLSEGLRRVRACGAETCRWLFLDTSKNHTRRWCDMKVCGNRMKARRFQARHA